MKRGIGLKKLGRSITLTDFDGKTIWYLCFQLELQLCLFSLLCLRQAGSLTSGPRSRKGKWNEAGLNWLTEKKRDSMQE